MTLTTILLGVFGALLVAAYALWDLGAHRLIASFGRFVIRSLSFGRIRGESEIDEGMAIGVSTAIVLVFVCVLVIASRVR